MSNVRVRKINKFHNRTINTTSFKPERNGLCLLHTVTMRMLLLKVSVHLYNSVWHWLNSLRIITSPEDQCQVHLCIYIWFCVDTQSDYFCNKRWFNTCVTTGTAHLKSNTLQESITCWVYCQRTELKWPTEKGRRVLFEEHSNKMMEKMITEVSLQANVNIFQMH